MKRFAAGAIGAIGAISFCAVTVGVVESLGISVRFPAYAGEDDFSFRATWFFLFVLPGSHCLAAGSEPLQFAGFGRHLLELPARYSAP